MRESHRCPKRQPKHTFADVTIEGIGAIELKSRFVDKA